MHLALINIKKIVFCLNMPLIMLHFVQNMVFIITHKLLTNKTLLKITIATTERTFLLKYLENRYCHFNFVMSKTIKIIKKLNRDNMKNKVFTLTMMLLISSTSYKTFANIPDNYPTTYTGEPDRHIHKSIHRLYIIDSFENGIYTLTFNYAFFNAEIKIYKDGILVEDYCDSYNAGQVYTTNLKAYGTGVYITEVYNNGNKIFCGSEEI